MRGNNITIRHASSIKRTFTSDEPRASLRLVGNEARHANPNCFLEEINRARSSFGEGNRACNSPSRTRSNGARYRIPATQARCGIRSRRKWDRDPEGEFSSRHVKERVHNRCTRRTRSRARAAKGKTRPGFTCFL